MTVTSGEVVVRGMGEDFGCVVVVVIVVVIVVVVDHPRNLTLKFG